MTIKFKRLKEILIPEANDDLGTFLYGQTTEVNGIFESDFLRWIYKQKVID